MSVASNFDLGQELQITQLCRSMDRKKSAAATTGDGSAAATTGDRSAAATTGDRSAASALGKNSIAAALGIGARARSNTAIMLARYDNNYNITHVFAGMVDGCTIKGGVWYELDTEGRPVECAEQK